MTTAFIPDPLTTASTNLPTCLPARQPVPSSTEPKAKRGVVHDFNLQSCNQASTSTVYLVHSSAIAIAPTGLTGARILSISSETLPPTGLVLLPITARLRRLSVSLSSSSLDLLYNIFLSAKR